MPQPYVRKLADKHGISVEKAEEKWNAAKKDAADQGHSEDYGYITNIFKLRMHEKSSLHSFLQRVLAFDKTKTIPEEQLLPVLMEDLSNALGGMKQIPVQTHGKIPSRVYLTVSRKANQVKKVLSKMDFSVVQINGSGYTGGTRWEAESDKTTVVNYCEFSGVLVISSTLNFES